MAIGYPKPTKKEKEKITAAEFRKRYGRKASSSKNSKSSKTERRKAIDRADEWFSRYVRLYYANNQLQVRCCTSGRWYHIKDIDCGHFMSRNNYNTRWEFKNALPQGKQDNRFRSGRQFEMGKVIDQIHGPGTAEKMEQMAHWRGSTKTVYDIRQIAAKYRTLFNYLCKERGIVSPWGRNA